MSNPTSVQLTLRYTLKTNTDEQRFIELLRKRMNSYLTKHADINHGMAVEVKHERV